MLREYLGDNAGNSPWTIRMSPLSGRGVFASRDLNPGDVVFRDVPLVLGPRSGSSSPPICVGCHTMGTSTLEACSHGCGLPVCSTACETAPHHLAECQLLQRLGRTEWSMHLLKTVTPLRCLLLPAREKQLLLCLQAHYHPQHGFEQVEFLRGQAAFSPADERFLVQACCVLDANAFETVTPNGSSIRGLFPLAALMNHQCTPNTNYVYDEKNRMVVRAAVHIPAGTEITDSYTPLLWATLARRTRLEATKHFLCSCPRCEDPQEMGARLDALKCARESCSGFLLSTDPLRATSKWRCEVCGLLMPARQVVRIHNTLSGLLSILGSKDPEKIRMVLQKNSEVLPACNQIAVEMKSSMLWLYGHCEGYIWPELSDTILAYKEALCREMLQLVETLRAGQCRLRGLYLYELHCTLAEKARRDGQDISQEAITAIQEAARIFQDDVVAPTDVWRRLQDATNK
ncbi:SET domain-containing protein SmydA-8 [Anabrus simplex]|uniref:SET domain-containing protein SmydA-8 n=1 Tax=Anabrus simplex TaxID=316456 RepID=UPI0034DD1A75